MGQNAGQRGVILGVQETADRDQQRIVGGEP